MWKPSTVLLLTACLLFAGCSKNEADEPPPTTGIAKTDVTFTDIMDFMDPLYSALKQDQVEALRALITPNSERMERTIGGINVLDFRESYNKGVELMGLPEQHKMGEEDVNTGYVNLPYLNWELDDDGYFEYITVSCSSGGEHLDDSGRYQSSPLTDPEVCGKTAGIIAAIFSPDPTDINRKLSQNEFRPGGVYWRILQDGVLIEQMQQESFSSEEADKVGVENAKPFVISYELKIISPEFSRDYIDSNHIEFEK